MTQVYVVKYVIENKDGSVCMARTEFYSLDNAKEYSKTVKSEGIYSETREQVTKVTLTNIENTFTHTYYIK